MILLKKIRRLAERERSYHRCAPRGNPKRDLRNAPRLPPLYRSGLPPFSQPIRGCHRNVQNLQIFRRDEGRT